MSNPYAPPPPGRKAPERPAQPDRAGRPAQQPGRPQGDQPGKQQGTRPGQQPGRRPGQQPGRPQPQRPVVPQPPADPAAVELAGRRMRVFLVALLVTILTQQLLLPWQLATIGTGLVAAVLGLRAVRAGVRARLPRGLVVLTGLGSGFAAAVAMSTATILVFWPLPLENQTCLRGAITITARQECAAELRQGMLDRMGQQADPGLVDRFLPGQG